MKLSEIIEAISNNAIVDDRENPESVDVFLMIQDATNTKEVLIRGYINGDDARLASMIADRMVKNKEFCNIIDKALELYLVHKIIIKNKKNNQPS